MVFKVVDWWSRPQYCTYCKEIYCTCKPQWYPSKIQPPGSLWQTFTRCEQVLALKNLINLLWMSNTLLVFFDESNTLLVVQLERHRETCRINWTTIAGGKKENTFANAIENHPTILKIPENHIVCHKMSTGTKEKKAQILLVVSKVSCCQSKTSRIKGNAKTYAFATYEICYPPVYKSTCHSSDRQYWTENWVLHNPNSRGSVKRQRETEC